MATIVTNQKRANHKTRESVLELWTLLQEKGSFVMFTKIDGDKEEPMILKKASILRIRKKE